MFENIEKGMIIKLYEDDEDNYIVVDILIKNNDKYLVLNPVKNIESEDIMFNVKDMLLIKLLKNDEGFEYVKDIELAKEIVTELLGN